MKDVPAVLRYLAALDGATPELDQLGVTTAQHPDAVGDFVTAGCALVAATVKQALLTEATDILRNVNDYPAGQEPIEAGERIRAVGLALVQTQAERDEAATRFRDACAVLRGDGALADTATGQSGPR